MMIQPNTDMTGTVSDWVGIVMLIVRFVAARPVQTTYQVTVNDEAFVLNYYRSVAFV